MWIIQSWASESDSKSSTCWVTPSDHSTSTYQPLPSLNGFGLKVGLDDKLAIRAVCAVLTEDANRPLSARSVSPHIYTNGCGLAQFRPVTDLSGVEVPILVAKDLSEPPLVRDLPGPVHGLPQQLLCSNVYAVACPNYSGGRRLHGERPDAQSFK